MMLDILEEYCILRKFKTARIDGQTKGNDRQEAIDAFSRPDSDYFVFLLSTRAGGLGINLTAADTVIIYDSDWNPQNDSQATARCHRIGQKQEVTVYRLLTRHTYEYEMFERASRKLAIESVVLDRTKLNMQTTASVDGTPKEEEGEGVVATPETAIATPTPIESIAEEVPVETTMAMEEEEREGEAEEAKSEKSEKKELEALPESDEQEGGPAETVSAITQGQGRKRSSRKRRQLRLKSGNGEEEEDDDDEYANNNDDEEFVMSEEEEEDSDLGVGGLEEEEDEDDNNDDDDTLSTTTKTTRGDKQFVDDEYGVPAVPIIPVKKKRGRKSKKPRTLEDELNPYKRSKNEVEEMLRRGLFDCIMDSSVATSMEFFEADISNILENNTRAVGDRLC